MIPTKLIEVDQNSGKETPLGWYNFPTVPAPGHCTLGGEPVQIIGFRWEMDAPELGGRGSEMNPAQAWLVVAIVRPSSIAKPVSAPLVGLDGRPLS